MSESEKLFSLAGRIYVLLRRETSRMIDVEWMVAEPAYALEVIRLARTTNNAELIELAERVDAIHPLLLKSRRQPVMAVPDRLIAVPQARYVNTLR